MPRDLDHGHDAKRRRLARLLKLALVAAFAMILMGAMAFVGSILVDDIQTAAFVGFTGMFFIGGGGFLLVFLLPVAFFTHVGSLLRYGSAEVVPVAEDVARRNLDFQEEVAPRQNKLAEEQLRSVARGVRKGWEEGGRP